MPRRGVLRGSKLLYKCLADVSVQPLEVEKGVEIVKSSYCSMDCRSRNERAADPGNVEYCDNKR